MASFVANGLSNKGCAMRYIAILGLLSLGCDQAGAVPSISEACGLQQKSAIVIYKGKMQGVPKNKLLAAVLSQVPPNDVNTLALTLMYTNMVGAAYAKTYTSPEVFGGVIYEICVSNMK
jgi:hypothetical protein